MADKTTGLTSKYIDDHMAKIHTAEFYFERLLPRADGHGKSALAPTRSVMQIDKEHFAFN